jgi:hypothetical protein
MGLLSCRQILASVNASAPFFLPLLTSLLVGWPCQTSPLQKEVFGKRLSHVTIVVNVTHNLFYGLHDYEAQGHRSLWFADASFVPEG